MRKISGNLSLMSVTDLIQWAENSRRSGTLILSMQNREKRFYLQEGKIIFVWSACEGERFVDFLQHETAIDQKELAEAFADSKTLGIPILGYLHSKKIIEKARLEEILTRIAEASLTDALQWGAGLFEFTEELPGIVLNGPVRLNSSQVMLESVRIFDETQLAGNVDTNMILNEIRSRIEKDDFELPPIPDVMQQIMEKIDNPSFSIDDVIECITDQILISKILKICNSPYYRQIGQVSTLRDAVVFLGFKSLMSIITVHALSRFSPRNGLEIKKVLQHCLLCGMIARQIARDIGGNQEQAFICGLMHDIGKTIMLEMIDDYVLLPDVQEHLIHEHHAVVGCILAKRWNFSEEIQETILCHHNPEAAVKHQGLVEIIYLSDLMAHASSKPEDITNIAFNSVDVSQLDLDDFMGRINGLDQEAEAVVNM